MRRNGFLAAAVLTAIVALAPALALAKAGAGASIGSRGTQTYSAPPATSTAPSTAMPMQRSLTPQTAPSPSANPGFAGSPAMAGAPRSGFMSGLMGGLIGAGIGGMLFGGGLFHGISGFGGFLGFLLQIFLVVMIGRFLWRMFAGSRPALAPVGMSPDMMARTAGGPMPMGGGRPAVQPIAIQPADYQAFEQLLQGVQAAWSAQDINALRAVASPEMVSYFAEQLSEQASRGVHNAVTDVKLEQGDLSEAWAEPGREYATVAMRFSMVDVTRDTAGRVVEGDPVRRTETTEVWTFLRAPGGRWILSAIQQVR